MAIRNVNFKTELARKVGSTPKNLRKIKTKTKVNETINAVNYIMAKLEADDSTLATSMKKTIAEASVELAQLPEIFRLTYSNGNNGNFGCFWEYTIPFIVNGGQVISFDRSSDPEQVPFAKSFAKAIEHYVASKVGLSVSSNILDKTKKSKVKAAVTTNSASADAEIASMAATY